MSVCLYTHTPVCLYTCMPVAFMPVYMYTYIHTCTYTHIQIQIYIYKDIYPPGIINIYNYSFTWFGENMVRARARAKACNHLINFPIYEKNEVVISSCIQSRSF